MSQSQKESPQTLLRPAPLPRTTEGLLALRKTVKARTLNDYVEECHIAIWEDPDYLLAIEAVYDEDAIEGSLSADDYIAAGLIRKYAKDKNIVFVRDKKLATILKALKNVWKRYGITRKERKNTIGGEAVPPGE